MLGEIEKDGLLLFAARRQPIPLNIDYSHIQVPIVLSDTSSETPLARTSSLEEAMRKCSSLYDNQRLDLSNTNAHRPRQLLFSSQHPSFLNCEVNMVEAAHLAHYSEYYKISD
ncbi:hypothetical protein ACOSQ4_022708 [Xanthoceras sorbifolium]